MNKLAKKKRHAPGHCETEGGPEHNRENRATEYSLVEEQNATLCESERKIARKFNDEFTLWSSLPRILHMAFEDHSYQ